MIDKVVTTPLLRISDPRGDILHMLKSSDDVFTEFGEIYFSFLRPNSFKTWRRQRLSTSQICVPVGDVRILVADLRHESEQQGLILDTRIGSSSYTLVTIPPMVWYAFEAVSEKDALIANCASVRHDPTQVERCEADDLGLHIRWNH